MHDDHLGPAGILPKSVAGLERALLPSAVSVPITVLPLRARLRT
jgi:hypothetical protein